MIDTEATVLYAVGGNKAKKINAWRIKHESNIDRTKRNTYRRHLDSIGLEQDQYGNKSNWDGANNIGGNAGETNGIGQVSSGTQRRNNGGTVLSDSRRSYMKEGRSRILIIRSLGKKDLQESTVKRVLSLISNTTKKHGPEASEQLATELIEIVDSSETEQELLNKLDQMK